jgi:hypothetical protein
MVVGRNKVAGRFSARGRVGARPPGRLVTQPYTTRYSPSRVVIAGTNSQLGNLDIQIPSHGLRDFYPRRTAQQ